MNMLEKFMWRILDFLEKALLLRQADAYYYEPDDIVCNLPKRTAHSHKGTFGRVVVIARV